MGGCVGDSAQGAPFFFSTCLAQCELQGSRSLKTGWQHRKIRHGGREPRRLHFQSVGLLTGCLSKQC